MNHIRSNNIYRLFFFIALCLSPIYSSAQINKVKFTHFLEGVGNHKVKIYLNGIFQIAFKNCAKYYLITEFADTSLLIKDSVKVYYKNNKRFLTGAYKNGEPHGKFTMYYKNGRIKMSFEYENGKRSKLWQSYSPKGKLIKQVYYKNRNEYLIEMYDKKGKQIVKNGNGVFDDKIHLITTNDHLIRVVGKVKKGLFDGEWKFYTPDRFNYIKEYFDNFKFIKGISISKKAGSHEYNDFFMATYTGYLFLERLYLITPVRCGNKESYTPSRSFFKKLKKRFLKSSLSQNKIKRWFWVEMKGGRNGKVLKVKILSKAKNKVIDQLKQFILTRLRIDTGFIAYEPGYYYFPMVIKDSQVFCPGDKEIKLLNRW